MYRVKNITNSPHKIKLADGTDGRISARGEGDFDIHPNYIKAYERCGYLVLSEASADDQPGADKSHEARALLELEPDMSVAELKEAAAEIIDPVPFRRNDIIEALVKASKNG